MNKIGLWKKIDQMFKNSSNKINLIKSMDGNKRVVERLKINEESVLGNMLIHTSGVIINGYLRILGRDGELDILLFNKMVKKLYPGNKLFIASDIWGGLYAISNNDFEGDTRDIWYYAPDSLKWENMEIDYAQFIAWLCGASIQEYYKPFIWSGFKQIINSISPKQAVLFYPFLWTKECDVETANKKIIPLQELIGINAECQL